MKETISARVNLRLLSKAERLFTGTAEGRIIEILQNARRAGATEVRIANKDGFVTVQDNGSGITDFQKLLDLGGSGWDERLEQGEDPAGVGLFSLAPRTVEIHSGNKKAVIDREGWTGKPVEIEKSNKTVNGTVLRFKDEKPWGMDAVEQNAVFAGIRVIVDGKYCHQMPFCSSEAKHCKSPGCRIEVAKEISKYHRHWVSKWYLSRVLVNFHGQVVQMDYWPGKKISGLTILVDITDDTDLRLMLPARTQLVENEALEALKKAVELEYYRYYQKQKTHCLYYSEYLRAKELGIELKEAEPQYKAGLIWTEYNEAAEITVPKDFRLEEGYLCYNEDNKDETAETNAHLLSALGNFKDKPFIPVAIDNGYIGYSWSKLPKVVKVEVNKVKEKLRHSICCNELACFDKLSITVQTSDGKTFSSDVDMAIVLEPQKDKHPWVDQTVCVTKDARDNLSTDNIWLHLGGFDIEGDSYDTQEYYIEKALNEFWAELVGPYENLRLQLIQQLNPIYEKWRKITIFENGSLEIVFRDGKRQIISVPAESA